MHVFNDCLKCNNCNVGKHNGVGVTCWLWFFLIFTNRLLAVHVGISHLLRCVFWGGVVPSNATFILLCCNRELLDKLKNSHHYVHLLHSCEMFIKHIITTLTLIPILILLMMPILILILILIRILILYLQWNKCIFTTFEYGEDTQSSPCSVGALACWCGGALWKNELKLNHINSTINLSSSQQK